MTPITDWPVDERPREKLLQRGAAALSDAELLAIFLRTGRRGKTAVDLARDLLSEFGGLRALLNAEQTQFCAINGLGAAAFAQLQAVLEMGRRHWEEPLRRGAALTSTQAAQRFLNAQLRDHATEVFAALFLDTRHRIIAFEPLFRGSLEKTAAPPREVVRRALHHNAAAVIVAHNHPSGTAAPSAADHALTERLRDALTLMDIRLLDHIIIGADAAASMAQQGWR